MDKVPAGIIAKNNNALVFRYGVATGRCYRDLTTDTALDSYDGEPSTKIALSSLGVKASKPSARNRWRGGPVPGQSQSRNDAAHDLLRPEPRPVAPPAKNLKTKG
jgi:hypothetical protein